MLAGQRLQIDGTGAASDYAAQLLGALGASLERGAGPAALPAALEWARSGAMALTGLPDAAPRLAPAPLASCARGALDALRSLVPDAAALPADGAALLGERAAAFGYTRAGRSSPSGTCRLLRCTDGWLALNLPRPEDRASLPAWLEDDAQAGADWHALERRVASRHVDVLVERAAWLGLAAAHAAAAPCPTPGWLRWRRLGPALDASPCAAPWPRRPLVLDLSALWAGPLAAELLAAAGARVVKIESATRTDGTRRGPTALFDLWNGSKQSVVLELGSARGRAQLAALARRADCIVESTRPRALLQLGLDAEVWLAEAPGRTWLSLTGYGRDDPAPGRVAFGDDAAAAAGLAVLTGEASAPLFCGDAIADPLAGLHAALAVVAAWRSGGGQLLDVALRDVVAHTLACETPAHAPARVLESSDGFVVECAGRCEPVSAPRARRPRRRARALGSDSAACIAELGASC